MKSQGSYFSTLRIPSFDGTFFEVIDSLNQDFNFANWQAAHIGALHFESDGCFFGRIGGSIDSKDFPDPFITFTYLMRFYILVEKNLPEYVPSFNKI